MTTRPDGPPSRATPEELASHLPLRPLDVEILVATTRESVHGYQMLKAMNGGDGRMRRRVAKKTLYRALKRLGDESLIQAASPPERCPDPRRIYWAATPLGRAVLELELRRLATLISSAREGEP